MNDLIDDRGTIEFGIYDQEISRVNYLDYHLETVMGITVPRFVKSYLANQFHFIGITGPELIIGMAIIDLKYLTNCFIYVYDRDERKIIQDKVLSLPGAQKHITPHPEKTHSVFKSDDMDVEINHGHISAKGKSVHLVADLGLDSVPPLRICTRAGYRGWVYTQKTTPISISGQVSYHGKTISLSSPQYMALMDWSCGYMRRNTCWNWASSACTLNDGSTLGLNLSCGVNETSYTENFFMINGIMTKVDTVDFVFDKDHIHSPWHITSFDKKVDLRFTSESHRSEMINAVLVASRFTQLVGRFDGTLKTDDGQLVNIESCPGFTEDHYARW